MRQMSLLIMTHIYYFVYWSVILLISFLLINRNNLRTKTNKNWKTKTILIVIDRNILFSWRLSLCLYSFRNIQWKHIETTSIFIYFLIIIYKKLSNVSFYEITWSFVSNEMLLFIMCLKPFRRSYTKYLC